MTFAAYWKRLVDATPGLRRLDGSMRIGVLSFREAIRRAYETGRADAVDEARHETSNSMPDFFKGLFGGKR